MLSTRFGYRRPARFALAFAEALALADSFVDFFFGFGRFHGAELRFAGMCHLPFPLTLAIGAPSGVNSGHRYARPHCGS